MVSFARKRLNTGEGSRVTVKYPKTHKGKKILPAVYKVRSDKKGEFAVVGLYYRDKGKLSVYKNLIARIKKKRKK